MSTTYPNVDQVDRNAVEAVDLADHDDRAGTGQSAEHQDEVTAS
jgi:hypothetical protein